MIVISTEARIRLARHAWNVLPHEAFGFLLGTPAGDDILVALPCSQTAVRGVRDERWNGLVQALPKANETAALFGLQVVGVYGATDQYVSTDQPPLRPDADVLAACQCRWTLIYQTGCCKACSRRMKLHDGVRIRHWPEGYVESKGKRLNPAINQRRVYQQWRKRFGPVDYANG